MRERNPVHPVNVAVIGAVYWGKKVIGKYLQLASRLITDRVRYFFGIKEVWRVRQ